MTKAEPLIEPSEAERRNGWTAESLTRYVRQRGGPSFASRIPAPDRRRVVRVESTETHDPLEW